jgi:hypothetical protein
MAFQAIKKIFLFLLGYRKFFMYFCGVIFFHKPLPDLQRNTIKNIMQMINNDICVYIKNNRRGKPLPARAETGSKGCKPLSARAETGSKGFKPLSARAETVLKGYKPLSADSEAIYTRLNISNNIIHYL